MPKRCNLCVGLGTLEEETCPLCRGSGQFVEGCGSCRHFCFSPLSYQKSGGGSGYCTLALRRLVPGWPRKKGEWETMRKAIVRVDHLCKDYRETEREDATFGSWWRKEWPTLR